MVADLRNRSPGLKRPTDVSTNDAQRLSSSIVRRKLLAKLEAANRFGRSAHYRKGASPNSYIRSRVQRSRLFHNLIRTTQRPPGYVAHNISRDPGLVDCTVDLCGHIGLHSPSPSPQCG
eukprot:g2167.t1